MRQKTLYATALLGFLLLESRIFAKGQLPAPGAFSDFAGCSHHTCLWMPWSTHKVYQKGNYTYTVSVDHAVNDEGGEFILSHAGKELLRTELKELQASVSVVWSPDKRSFAVTWSSAGGSGRFHVRAFRINDERVVELPAAQTAFEEFKRRYWCAERGDSVQAYRWTEDSQDLVLVLSVYPTSDCGKQMGHTEGYLVEAATGQVKENWNKVYLNTYIRSHPEW